MSLTEIGFYRKRLNEIKAELDQSLNDALGPVNTNADSVVGQLSGIFSEAVDNAYEILQETYDAMYPFSAEGTSLDGAVALVGIERLPATETIVTAAAYGLEGTTIPAGSRAHADIQYFSSSDVVISIANTLDVTLEVLTVANSSAYSITAGGLSVTYTSDASATSDEIVAGLAALLDGDPLVAVVENGRLRIYAFDLHTPFELTADVKLAITKQGSPVVFVASEKGAHVVPVGGLSNIDTPISGWDSVYNLASGVVGHDIETDTELRARHSETVRVSGAATLQAIRSRILQEVDSVTSVSVYENRKHLFVGPMPPHSFEVVVAGGVDQDVANKIWELKPAGIETYGNTAVQVFDENGDWPTVNFSRPDKKYTWVRVSVNALYPEEPLLDEAVTAIKLAVLEYGTGIGIGKDVITQRFYGPIYKATTGIGRITVEVALTASPSGTPSYSTNNAAISRSEIPIFHEARISVVGV